MMLFMCFLCVLASESYGVFFGTLCNPVVSMNDFCFNLSVTNTHLIHHMQQVLRGSDSGISQLLLLNLWIYVHCIVF